MNIFIELKQLKEIRIIGRGFVCLFYAHFRADTIFQQALLFTHQMALFSQYFIFLTRIFTASILHMAAGCVCFLLICKLFNYTLTHPGSRSKFGEPDDSMYIPSREQQEQSDYPYSIIIIARKRSVCQLNTFKRGKFN